MGTITSTGLGSGLEVNNIVTSLVEAEKKPQIDKLEKEAQKATSQISALGEVNSLLSSLKSSYTNLNKTSSYNSTSASSTDENIVTATTGFGAEAGSYELEVQQLAQQHTLISNSSQNYSTVNDVVGGGTINIRFGSYSGGTFTPDANSTNQTIEIDPNASLTDIRDAINKEDNGVTASILYDGSSYRLTLQSDASGEKTAMEITVTDDDGNNTDATGLSTLAFDGTNNNMQQTLAAQDAKVVLNGIAITRESNSVSEVVGGVTFELNSAEIGKKVKVSVKSDTSTVESEIRAFVDKYNETMTKINDLTAYRSATDVGILNGDATARSIQSFMRNILNTRLENTDSTVKSMADLGIITKRDGTLEINEDTTNGLPVFSNVLAKQMEDVAKFFAKSGNSTSSSINYVSSNSLTKEGSYNVEITQVATQGKYTGQATLPADFSATPFVINESNNNFQLRVDGIKSNEITLTSGSYATEAALIAEIQSQINSDATLKDKGIGVSVAIENQQLVIKSNSFGEQSVFAVLSTDDNVKGSPVIDFSTPPFAVSGTSTFDISIGGYSGSIDVSGSYATEADFITALDSAISSATGENVTVEIVDKQLKVTSDDGSPVLLSNLGATTAAELGLSDTSGAGNLGLFPDGGVQGVNTKGKINGADALGDGQFLLAQGASGDANGLKVQINDVDISVRGDNDINAYPFTAAADTTFQLNIDGITSSTIDISGQSFTSDTDLVNAIQSALNADTNLSNAGESIQVSVVGGKLQFDSSSVDSALGITAAGAGAGSDLGLQVKEGTFSTTINYSEGITSKIDAYLDTLIDANVSNTQSDLDNSDSIIDGKIDALYKSLQAIDKKEEDINYRMDLYEKRLFKTFNAMDLLVNQLNGQSQALQGSLDALPGYTRNNN